MGANVWWDDGSAIFAQPPLLAFAAVALIVLAVIFVLARRPNNSIPLAYALALTPLVGVAFLLLFMATGSFMLAGTVALVGGFAGAMRLSR